MGEPKDPAKMKQIRRQYIDGMLMGYAMAKPEFMKERIEPSELLSEACQKGMWSIYEKNREAFSAFLEMRLGVVVDDSKPLIESMVEHAKKYNRDEKARIALAEAFSHVNRGTTADEVEAIVENLKDKLTESAPAK